MKWGGFKAKRKDSSLTFLTDSQFSLLTESQLFPKQRDCMAWRGRGTKEGGGDT